MHEKTDTLEACRQALAKVGIVGHFWSTEDVLEPAPFLTEDEAMEILREVERRADRGIGGINHDVVADAIRDWVKENEDMLMERAEALLKYLPIGIRVRIDEYGEVKRLYWATENGNFDADLSFHYEYPEKRKWDVYLLRRIAVLGTAETTVAAEAADVVATKVDLDAIREKYIGEHVELWAYPAKELVYTEDEPLMEPRAKPAEITCSGCGKTRPVITYWSCRKCGRTYCEKCSKELGVDYCACQEVGEDE